MDIMLKTLLVIAGLAVWLGLMITVSRNAHGGLSFGFRWVGALAGAVIFVTAVFLTIAIGQVDAGYRGTVLRFGAVTERTLGEGLYFVTPFLNSVQKMDVQIHAYETPASAASKDLQEVATNVTLNYHVDPEKVNRVYQTLRRDFVPRIIVPAVQEGVKAVTARFDAEELITKRPSVKTGIEEVLRERLAQNGIILETVSITNFQFSQAFESSIEAKQVAVQDALKAENDLRRIEVEARQAAASALGRANATIAEAEGAKQAAILKAEGEAQATITVAEAQAKANELVNSTLTSRVIQYALVQKLAEDINVIIVPTGQEFIFGENILGKKTPE